LTNVFIATILSQLTALSSASCRRLSSAGVVSRCNSMCGRQTRPLSHCGVDDAAYVQKVAILRTKLGRQQSSDGITQCIWRFRVWTITLLYMFDATSTSWKILALASWLTRWILSGAHFLLWLCGIGKSI